jgi:hypothetical protein
MYVLIIIINVYIVACRPDAKEWVYKQRPIAE